MQVWYGLLLRHTGVQPFDALAEFEIVLRCAEGMGASWGAVLLGEGSWQALRARPLALLSMVAAAWQARTWESISIPAFSPSRRRRLFHASRHGGVKGGQRHRYRQADC